MSVKHRLVKYNLEHHDQSFEVPDGWVLHSVISYSPANRQLTVVLEEMPVITLVNRVEVA